MAGRRRLQGGGSQPFLASGRWFRRRRWRQAIAAVVRNVAYRPQGLTLLRTVAAADVVAGLTPPTRIGTADSWGWWGRLAPVLPSPAPAATVGRGEADGGDPGACWRGRRCDRDADAWLASDPRRPWPIACWRAARVGTPPGVTGGAAERRAAGGGARTGYGGSDTQVDLRVDDHPDPVTELGRLLTCTTCCCAVLPVELTGAVAEEVRDLLTRRAMPGGRVGPRVGRRAGRLGSRTESGRTGDTRHDRPTRARPPTGLRGGGIGCGSSPDRPTPDRSGDVRRQARGPPAGDRGGVPCSYRKGQVLFEQDDPGDSLIVLKRGAVVVYRTSPAGTGRVDVGRPPDVFGEVSLLDDSRSASAEAIETVAVAAFSGSVPGGALQRPSWTR